MIVAAGEGCEGAVEASAGVAAAGATCRLNGMNAGDAGNAGGQATGGACGMNAGDTGVGVDADADADADSKLAWR